MKKSKKYAFLFGIVYLIALSSCANLKPGNHHTDQSSNNMFAIIQDSNYISISGADTLIHISKAPFTLQFMIERYSAEKKQKYAAQIATTGDSLNRKFFTEGEISKLNPFYS